MADQLFVPAELDAHNCVSLTTFRKDGRPVATAVWFVIDGDVVRITTGATSGKVKRIRATADVEIAACDQRGRIAPDATRYRGTARIVDAVEAQRTEQLLNRKYGIQKAVFGLGMRLLALVGKGPGDQAALAVDLTDVA